MKETGYSFSFYFLVLTVLTDMVASVIGMSFFHLWFRLKFSRVALLRKRLQVVSKSDLITNGLFFVFLCGYMPRVVDFMSAWTKICKNCSNVILF